MLAAVLLMGAIGVVIVLVIVRAAYGRARHENQEEGR
jgi:hypothetical protein